MTLPAPLPPLKSPRFRLTDMSPSTLALPARSVLTALTTAVSALVDARRTVLAQRPAVLSPELYGGYRPVLRAQTHTLWVAAHAFIVARRLAAAYHAVDQVTATQNDVDRAWRRLMVEVSDAALQRSCNLNGIVSFLATSARESLGLIPGLASDMYTALRVQLSFPPETRAAAAKG